MIGQHLLILLLRLVNRLHSSWPLVEVDLVAFLHAKISRPNFHVGSFMTMDWPRAAQCKSSAQRLRLLCDKAAVDHNPGDEQGFLRSQDEHSVSRPEGFPDSPQPCHDDLISAFALPAPLQKGLQI